MSYRGWNLTAGDGSANHAKAVPTQCKSSGRGPHNQQPKPWASLRDCTMSQNQPSEKSSPCARGGLFRLHKSPKFTTHLSTMHNPQDEITQRPEFFNFAADVIDYWAAQPGNLQAMHWVSQDESYTRTMTFEYFSRQSRRIAVLLEQLGFKEGETMIIILPRVPAW